MKSILFIVIGIAVGMWMGVNIGKGNALYENPFSDSDLFEDVLDSADDEGLLDKGEALLEDTKEKMKESAKEAVDKL